LLCVTAGSIGFLHTVLGPDHYLPFIVMSRVRRWSKSRTFWVTFLCGLGHVLGSIALGLVGAAVGFGLSDLKALQHVEAVRGGLAAWLLTGFGFAYCVWGLRRAVRGIKHAHTHEHERERHHEHEHSHLGDHSHVHTVEGKTLTPWILFTIFVFGPCEPLIPVLMYPAFNHSVPGMIMVAIVFSAATIMTMLAVVLLGAWGISFARLGRLERFGHAFAGGAIGLSGIAIQVLGL